MPASSHSRSDLGLRIRVAPEEVVYWHWQLRDSGWGGWVTMAIVAGTTLLAGWASETLAMAALTFVSLAIITWRTWLPIWVEIGPSGVTQTVLGRRIRIPWMAVRHYHIGRHGVLLSPDEIQNPFSPLRGLYLCWGKQRTEVLANFEYYLQSWNAGRTSGSDSTDRTQTALPG